MGLPSGRLWAKSNIDLSQASKFAASPEQYEATFFSWGNIDGHNPISDSAFEYNWGGVNEQAPWYENQPYGSTPGAAVQTNIDKVNDAARMNLGWPWRMPTNEEFDELFANIKFINADGTEVDTSMTDKRVTVNGIMGLYLQSKINGARIFLACCGLGIEQTWQNRATNGNYWSSTNINEKTAHYLNFSSGGVLPHSYNNRFRGYPIRPVW